MSVIYPHPNPLPQGEGILYKNINDFIPPFNHEFALFDQILQISTVCGMIFSVPCRTIGYKQRKVRGQFFMARLIIGFDTGGTYTDAALVDTHSRQILTKAKAVTTKGDLSVGVSEALAAVFAAKPNLKGDTVAMVCLSTTLATNAIVEGHGSQIGVILIGFDDKMVERAGIAAALPGVKILRCAGGHTYSGLQKEPLDSAAIANFITQTRGEVEAYAVAAEYSVRNPAHEQAAQQLIAELSGKPVTASSDLAHALDAPRRALTAALNARIISRIVALIGAVQRSMVAFDIHAPLMVVKGDGTLASAAKIVARPIETVLSGPAASVIGAKFLSGLEDFVVSDIGGTTTDIAVLEQGWPKLTAQGALVGGHRTLVRTIDMRTFALGGDSEVDFNDVTGKVVLKPSRIVPLSLLGHRYPSVVAELRSILADPDGANYASRFALRPFGGQVQTMPQLGAKEQSVYERIADVPVRLDQIIHSPQDMRILLRLVKMGLAQLAGFTPSDAAHVLDKQSQWSREAALLGGLAFTRWRRMASPRAGEHECRAFAQEVFDAVVFDSGRVLIETLADAPVKADDPFIIAALDGRGTYKGLNIAIRPSSPLVAVGGPGAIYYPELGRRMNCEIVLPPFGDVANAVGAAVGVIKVQAIVEVTSTGVGHYRIHHAGGLEESGDAGEALAKAHIYAQSQARAHALELGTSHSEMTMRLERVDLPNMKGDTGLVAATIYAECWGAPDAQDSL